MEVGGLTARKERTATTSYKEPYKATTDTEKESRSKVSCYLPTALFRSQDTAEKG